MSEGKDLVLGVLHSNNAHTEYPVLSNSQWNVNEKTSPEQQTRKISNLYHYSMLTRNRERSRFQTYSEDPQNELSSGGGDGFLSSGSSVLKHEMLDLGDEDVFDTSNDVAVVTTFILEVSTSLEFDSLLNKRIEQLNINGIDEAFEAIKKIGAIFCQRPEMTWNDICTFLYCSYRIVCKSLPLGISAGSVIKFATEWLIKEALDWIVACGGWSSLLVASITPIVVWTSLRLRNWSQYFGYFALAFMVILPVLFVIYKRRK